MTDKGARDDEVDELRRRLQEAEDTVHAIRTGAVDGFVVQLPDGQHRIYTLEGADRPYRTLVEKMQQGAATLMADGTIAYCNKCFADLLGMPHEKVAGAALGDFVVDADRGACAALLEDGRSGAAQVEASLLGPAGNAIPTLLTLNTMPPDSGMAFGLLVTDLTAQRHQERLMATLSALRATEEALRGMTADLSASNRRKDEFLATLAHELRNPLAPIRSALQVMNLTADGATVSRARRIAERQVQHMVRLVDDLLDVSRITQDKLKLRRQSVKLADLVRDAVEANQVTIDNAKHELTVKIPSEPIWLDVDPARMTQVLANLLNNAAKYTPENGRITLAARFEHAGAGTSVCVSVTDTGIGIKPEMLPRIFDMFTQADSTLDRSQGGLGIGLTLVRRLVQMHGGTVEVSSAGPGKGSEFVVRLPYDGAAKTGSTKSSDAAPSRVAQPLRVLVVDDNADAAEALAVLLRLMGHDVHLASDGPGAIDLARECDPDLVLMDIGLPGMSGYEIATFFRRQLRMVDTTLVAVTGWGQEADRQRAKDAGFDRHITKPVEPELLEKILASVHARRPIS